jgi:hypothetical protein
MLPFDQVRKRIQSLIAVARKAATPSVVEFPSLTPELEERIFDDVLQGRVLTFKQAAAKLGCSPEKVRLDSQGFPIIKQGREHRIPECVFRLIVRSKLIAA